MVFFLHHVCLWAVNLIQMQLVRPVHLPPLVLLIIAAILIKHDRQDRRTERAREGKRARARVYTEGTRRGSSVFWGGVGFKINKCRFVSLQPRQPGGRGWGLADDASGFELSIVLKIPADLPSSSSL